MNRAAGEMQNLGNPPKETLKLKENDMIHGKNEGNKEPVCLFSEEHVQLIKDQYKDWFNKSLREEDGKPRVSILPIPEFP